MPTALEFIHSINIYSVLTMHQDRTSEPGDVIGDENRQCLAKRQINHWLWNLTNRPGWEPRRQPDTQGGTRLGTQNGDQTWTSYVAEIYQVLRRLSKCGTIVWHRLSGIG